MGGEPPQETDEQAVAIEQLHLVNAKKGDDEKHAVNDKALFQWLSMAPVKKHWVWTRARAVTDMLGGASRERTQ